ncbi:MAG: hypothetical protein J0I06_19615, partial [Planctomycetes bacterium]|nr:hypothetical protein [Planctomycetota bacterium]
MARGEPPGAETIDHRVAQGIDSLVSQFERRWLRGTRTPLDAFLPPGPHRLAVLVELVHAELEFRLKAGEPARVEEYLGRYPELQGAPALVSLVHTEYRVRRRADPAVSWDEFRARFPGVPELTTDPDDR